SSEPLRSRRLDLPHRPSDHPHDDSTLLSAMLDATEEQTAVADAHGCLLAANAAWRCHDGQAVAPVREARWIRRGVRAVWAGRVTHEFNNLLTVINGFGHLALNLEPPAHLRDCLEKICRAGESAAYLTHRLHALGRKSNGKPIRLDAADFLAELGPAIHQAA